MLDANPTITDRMDALTTRAHFFSSQRRKDGALYVLLADCLAICEEAIRDNLVDELRASLKVSVDMRNSAIHGQGRALSNNGKGTRYVEAASDIYLIVGRCVFDNGANRDMTQRASAWRYSAVLREAAKNNIPSAELAEWLRTRGGINALFNARAVASRTAKTKTLRLNQQITVSKDAPFTITLQRDSRGFFDVVPS